MMSLSHFSIGIGDRFGLEGEAQLAALEQARGAGIDVVPVWNKSHREHGLTGTVPEEVRREAEDAVCGRGWKHPYFVDADHVTLKTVDAFLGCCDFFTLDVADAIGQAAEPEAIEAFVERHREFVGDLRIPGVESPFVVTGETLRRVARTYLEAVHAAGRLYRHIRERETGEFVVEISVDEAADSHTPLDVFFILAMVSDEGIPVQTLAPRFSGRFNKGIDYVGDVNRFAREFEEDLAAIRLAVDVFGLPPSLKVSVHSGSDKFSLYPAMRQVLQKTGAGIHLKTAGTTWLEELAGLAQSGGEGLDLARRIYRAAHGRREELCAPYVNVIDIEPNLLPEPDEVDRWKAEEFGRVLTHIPTDPLYNPHVRQLLHVAYPIAAEWREEFEAAVGANRDRIAERVTRNLFSNHLRPLLLGG